MKIVCGTDFSQHAAEAADVAAALAAHFNETLVLIHVLEATRYELFSEELFDELRSRRLARLKEESSRLRKTGATVEEHLFEGSPSTAVSDFAAKANARMIVVSSLGQIAPSRWLVGSVAERIAQTSPVPTLVVPAPMQRFGGFAGCERLAPARSMWRRSPGPRRSGSVWELASGLSLRTIRQRSRSCWSEISANVVKESWAIPQVRFM